MRNAENRKLLFALRMWFVPTLLIVVACIHMRQWRTENRSSWGTGAGFGMFATVDNHGTRFFKCVGQTDQGEVQMEIPVDLLNDDGIRTRAMPIASNLKRFADSLASRTWFLSNRAENETVMASTNETNSTGGQLKIYQIEVAVWGVRLETAEQRIANFLIKQDSFEYRAEMRESHVAVY